MKNKQKRKKEYTPEQQERIVTKEYFDRIAPGVVRFYTDHYICGNFYKSCWTVTEYPPTTEETAMTDFRGNAIEEKTNDEIKRTCTYYANGQLASQTDALGNTATYEYNFLNKLTKTSTPFNSVNYSITENQYDKNGNVILTRQTVQEENSSEAKYSITQNEYNALGLLTQVTLSGTGSSEKNISKYFYNNAGIQTKMYTGLSSENDTTYLTTEYTYDSWMRAISTSDSTGYNSGTVTYDLNGNVLTSTDANGNVTTNTYDALNRVLTSDTVNPDDSSKNVSKSYTYDNMGRITKTTSNDVTTTYAYDAMGRKYTESEYTADGNYSVFRGYFYEGVSKYMKEEITGLYHTLMYSNKTYEYDDEMRIVKVMESGNETVSYTYDANGNKKTETLANGVVSTYTYNNANRITKIENKSGNTDISTYEYSYYLDGSDACKVRTENGIIESTSYEYDGLKRLTEESVAVGSNTTDTYTYEYDDYGNRSKMTANGTENYTTVYSYSDSNGNYTALLQKETKTVEAEENPLDLTSNVKYTVYTYDANGNQITKTADGKTETNIYNGLNQLIGFTDGETTASYAYNVSGLRYEKTVNGQTINHVWDGSQQIVADIVDSQFYEANCYIRGTNLVAKYSFFNGTKSEYTYYTQNAHGDVVNLTDAEGNVTKAYTYDAFGVEVNPDSGDINVFRFCGEYFDTETGTVYLRARYYQASIGRFITRDSYTGKINDPLSLNLYTYCHNNPIVYYDPSGHSILSDIMDCWLTGAKDIAEWHKIGTQDIQAACMNKKGTLALTAGGSVQMGPLSGGASSGFCIDWNGDVGFMYTYTYMFDPLKAEDPEHVLNTIDENFKNRYNASASIAGTKTNAKSISELAGNGADFGISGIPAGNLGIDASKCVGFEEGSCKIANHGTTIGVSVNANPSKPGVSYDFSYTGVEKMFNIFDLMYKIDDAILSW